MEGTEMKIGVLVLTLCTISVATCYRGNAPQTNTKDEQSKASSRVITRDQAVSLANAEAIKEHKSLDRYNVNAREETKTWSVEFRLKDLTMGGGLTFIIDKESGKILERRESQ